MKQCTVCHQLKPLSEFHIYHRKLVSGEKAKRRAAYCRECGKKRSKERRERLKREGKAKAENRRNYLKSRARPNYKQQRSEVNKRYRERNYDKVREREREYAVIRRRKAGMKSRGPWMKYREKPSSSIHLPIKPIQDYLQEKIDEGYSIHTIAAYAGMEPTVIEKIRRGTEFRSNGKKYNKPSVAESTVDKILLGMHEPHMFNELYPIDERG